MRNTTNSSCALAKKLATMHALNQTTQRKRTRTMKSEHTANSYLAAQATERARWTAVLAPVAKTITQRRAVRKNFIARFLGL